MVSTIINSKRNQSWEEVKSALTEKFLPVLMGDAFESLLTLKHEQAMAKFITQFKKLGKRGKRKIKKN